MGVAIMCVAGLGIPLIHFPPWGSMFWGPTEGCDEVLYYLSEYTADEIKQGSATASMKFAMESKSQRGVAKGGWPSLALSISASKRGDRSGRGGKSAEGGSSTNKADDGLCPVPAAL